MDKLLDFIVEIKFLLATCIVWVQTFLGVTYDLVSAIMILTVLDIIVGLIKAHKIQEKFTASKLFNNLHRGFLFMIALGASIIADPFFIQYGFATFFIAKSIASGFGIWLFLHILENLGKMGLPIVENIKNIIFNKIKGHKDDENNSKQ